MSASAFPLPLARATVRRAPVRARPRPLLCATATLAALGLAAPVTAQSAPDTVTRITINGFVDTYYAYDATRPPAGDRQFTTQAVRHDEVNVNLAWLGLTLSRARTRARVAVQAGTSVQSNYAGEPRVGVVSGPSVSQFIQEAVVGYRLRDKLWIDAGIYSSYIGLESWSSGDNLTYTRSLVADYSPYYLSGAKLTWQATPKLTAQLHVTNGWQNISESNRRKAVGVRMDYAVFPSLTVMYANFIGDEQPERSGRALRVFNQLMAKGTVRGMDWQAQVDVGTEGSRQWYGTAVTARRALTAQTALVGRVERYSDPDQAIIPAVNTRGFVGNGASLGVDVLLDDRVRWRTEGRLIRTDRPQYRRDDPSLGPVRNNPLLVTSLSVAF
jgi:hypothetical protein